MKTRLFYFLFALIFWISCNKRDETIIGGWHLENIKPESKEEVEVMRDNLYFYYNQKVDSMKKLLAYYDSVYADTIKPAQEHLLRYDYIDMKNLLKNFENTTVFERYLSKQLTVTRLYTEYYTFKPDHTYRVSNGMHGQWQLKGKYLEVKWDSTHTQKVRLLTLNDSIMEIIFPLHMKYFDEDFNFVYEFRKIQHPNNKK